MNTVNNNNKVFGVPYHILPTKTLLVCFCCDLLRHKKNGGERRALFFPRRTIHIHIYYTRTRTRTHTHTHTHIIGARHEERHAKVDHGHVPLENENRETRGEKSLVSTRDAVDERGHRRTTEMVERDGESEPGENGGWGGQFYGREERKNHVSRG